MQNSTSPRLRDPFADVFDSVDNHRRSRKIGNNTYLRRRDENTVALLYHSTGVITYSRDGSVTLDSGGWRTCTTRERINWGLRKGLRLVQERRVWYIEADDGSRWVFEDGMILRPDGRVEGAERYDEKTLKASLKVQRLISKFSKDYIAALRLGRVPAPSGGDCWGCFMRAEPGSIKEEGGLVTMLVRQDGQSAGTPVGELGMFGDHLDGHIREKYYVPSLLARAVEVFPISIIAHDTLAILWGAPCEPQVRESILSGWGSDISFDQLERSLRRYLLSQQGLLA